MTRDRLDLRTDDGRVLPLDIRRYLAEADTDDDTVLARAVGPVLDVGCGPGRIVHALAASGIAALGVDVAEVAVELTAGRGASALMRSVFDRVPGEGRWPTILLLDGNIGIGGDVGCLLRRLVVLMAGGGQLIIEAAADAPWGHEVLSVRFGVGQRALGPAFSWSVIGASALARVGQRCGLVVSDQWSAGGRVFVRLVARNLDSR